MRSARGNVFARVLYFRWFFVTLCFEKFFVTLDLFWEQVRLSQTLRPSEFINALLTVSYCWLLYRNLFKADLICNAVIKFWIFNEGGRRGWSLTVGAGEVGRRVGDNCLFPNKWNSRNHFLCVAKKIEDCCACSWWIALRRHLESMQTILWLLCLSSPPDPFGLDNRREPGA